MAGRPGDPSSSSAAKGPKKGVGFANVYSMNTQPPPPAQPPRNDRPNVTPPPPGPNQGGLPKGPSNPSRPTLAPAPFSGPPKLQNTGIFSGTGIRDFDLGKFIDDQKLPDTTPSKTNKDTTAEVQDPVEPGMTDEQLLDVFRRRVDSARGDKTVEQRKSELEQSVQPWIDAGLGYQGPKRPGLYLPDGTRNPARPARGSTIPVSPGVIPTGTGTAPADTGKPPAGPGKGPKGTKAPEPTGKGKKSSTGTGISSTIGKGNKSSTGTGTSSSTGTKAAPPPKAGKEPKSLPVTGKGLLSGTGKSSSSGIRKGSTKSKVPSPLSRPPIRPGDPEEVINDTPTGTDGAGWRRRDDLFEAQVMDAAGIEFFLASKKISAVPTLASTIDYNTENWE